MKTKQSPFEKGKTYKDNTKFGSFLLYRFVYPVVNKIGLNRRFNLLRHSMGYYAENYNGLCQWCGENHLLVPLSEYKEKSIDDLLTKLKD